MNFLAHCLLADNAGVRRLPQRESTAHGDGFLAGGVLGDFVKGEIPDSLPTQLRAGIRLHRRIDSYSNRLPEMKASVARFGPAMRRVAPVLLDIVADHCLALAWPRFAHDAVSTFTARVYAALGRFDDCVPEHGRRFVDRMIATDLLARYAERAVVHRAMEHVLGRLRSTHLGGRLNGLLDDGLPALEADFGVYFPLLQAFASTERAMASRWAVEDRAT